ncbi:MAG: hypothetical protein ACK4HE_02070 [Chitinophagaceae bacterium]
MFTNPNHDVISLKEIFKKQFELHLLKRSYRNEVKIQKKIELLQESLFPNRLRDEVMIYSHKINRNSSLNYTLLPKSEIIMVPEIAEKIILGTCDHITVICMRLKTIRILDAYLRYLYNKKTNTVCESLEFFFENLILSESYYTLEYNPAVNIELIEKAENYRSYKYANNYYLKETCRYLTLLTLKGLYDRKNFNDEIAKIDTRKILFSQKSCEYLLNKSGYYGISMNQEIKYNLNFYQKIRLHRQALRKKFTPLENFVNISTVHSYKGFENNRVVLILELKFDKAAFTDQFDEIVYTALTRTISTLEVYNCANTLYDPTLSNILK